MKKSNAFTCKYLLVFCLIILGFSKHLNAQQWGKYTLVATKNTTVKLIDTASAVYKTWTLTGSTAYSSYLLPGGVLLRSVSASNTVFTGGGMHGRVQKIDWNGNIIWDYTYSSTTYCAHHDICAMPNGNVLMIVYELKSATETSAAGCSTSKVLWPDKIIEVKPTGATTGTIVWEWHVWDHLVQNVDATKTNYQTSILAHPELININYKNTGNTKDWMHSNGLDYNVALDQITFSSHNLNEVYVLDHSTTTAQAASHSGGNSGKGGDLLYRWGNPAAYGATGTANFNVVHDAHWVPADCPRGGSLAGFNNGATTSYSGADIFYPPYNGYNYSYTTGTAYSPSTYDKRILCNGKTTNEGNSQQLPNGNTLYCIALSGNIYEVDSNGTSLWNYSAGAGVSQASRYSDCYVNGPSKVSASSTITSICLGQSVQLIANASGIAAVTYSWLSNVGGYSSTTQNPIVSPTITTTYNVTATSNGCSTTNAVTVVVKSKPTTSAINGISSVIAASTIGYKINATTNSTYNWLVNGGTILNGNGSDSITIQWGSGSTGLVKVIETNGEGCVGDTILLNIGIGSSSLIVNPNNVSFDSKDSSVQLKVNSNATWLASANQSWVSLSKLTGSNIDSLTISCSANTSVNRRNSIITFVSGSNSFYVNVSQAGIATIDSLSLNTNIITTDYLAVNKTVQLFCNTNWLVSKKPSWITISNMSGTGNATLNLTIDKNTGTANRTDTIVISAGSLTTILVINQGFEASVLEIDIDTIIAPYNGKTVTVNITSNIAWTASSNQSWVTLSNTSGTLSGSTNVTIANNDLNERNAVVTFLAGSLSKSIVVIQNKNTTGLNNLLSDNNSFNIFPNPANETFEITGTGIGFGDFKISVYNTAGILVAEYENTTSINVSNLKDGLYQVKYDSNSGRHFTRKIVISK